MEYKLENNFANYNSCSVLISFLFCVVVVVATVGCANSLVMMMNKTGKLFWKLMNFCHLSLSFAGPSQLTLCSSETLRHRLKDRIPMPRSAKSQRLSHQCGTCWRPIIKMWVWEHRASSFRWHFSDENSFLLLDKFRGRRKNERNYIFQLAF